jgi:exosortase
MRVNVVLLGLLLVAACIFLAPQWRQNPDLTHGWLTPFAFLFLLHEAREHQPRRFLKSGWRHMAAVVTAGLLGMGALFFGGLYMAALTWEHALVAFLLTLSLVFFLGAGWLCAATEKERLLPFNWTVAAALLIWLLSAPLPPGSYGVLTRLLQNLVTSTVLGLLHFCGVAAVQYGNILQLANVTVGVEEACSGIRSLVTCFYTGLFISAGWLRRPWPRAILILLAPLLAVAGNIVRSFTLTVLAWRGVEIAGVLHDVTGYAIIIGTTLILIWLAQRLARSEDAGSTPQTRAADQATAASAAPPGPSRGLPILTVILALAVGSAVALIAVSRHPASAPQRTPDLAGLLPTKFENWQVIPSQELSRFVPQLQTETLVQTSYYRVSPTGGTEITFYFAYWPAGKVPISAVAAHTPDACWPGAGWVPKKDSAEKRQLTVGGRTLDAAEQRIFTQNEQIQHVWYWHLYGGRVIHPDDVRSPRQLLSLAWEYGFRQTGEQLFVRVSSNQPWEKLADEPLVKEVFSRLAAFGL